MAQMVKKQKGDITFACYSERRIIAHLMFRALSCKLDEFLRLLHFSEGVPHPFSEAKPEHLREITLFSEMDLGDFGNPDGAIVKRQKATANNRATGVVVALLRKYFTSAVASLMATISRCFRPATQTIAVAARHTESCTVRCDSR